METKDKIISLKNLQQYDAKIKERLNKKAEGVYATSEEILDLFKENTFQNDFSEDYDKN